jgi:hypothetical protein
MDVDVTTPATGEARARREQQMGRSATGWLAPARVARWLLLGGGLLFLVTYVAIALLRITHPFELEWLEGGTLEHVRRVLAGDPLYVAPSMEFVPLLYPPLYYYVGAGAAQLLGDGFVPLRLVSFLASLGCFALLFDLVRRETGSPYAGAIAATLFAATFRQGGAWLDLARVDSLFLFLFFAAVHLIRRGASPRVAIAAGTLIALSYLTKQSALAMAAPLFIYAAVRRPRFAAWLVGTVVVLLGATTLLLNALSDGWYWYYTLEMPRHHALVQHRFIGFWTEDLLRPLPIAAAAAAAYLAMAARTRHWDRLLFYGALAAGLVGAAYMSRLHSGGYDNVMLPAYAAAAVLLALALHEAVGMARRSGADPARGSVAHEARAPTAGPEVVAYGVVALQFLLLVYNPAAQLPTADDRAAGHELVATIAGLEGQVWIPGHGYLATLAGKRSYAHAAMVTDVIRAGDSRAKELMVDDLSRAIREHRFDALIMDSEFPPRCGPRGEYVTDINWFCQDLHDHYVKVRDLVPAGHFWPRTGVRRKPQALFVPSSAVTPAPPVSAP